MKKISTVAVLCLVLLTVQMMAYDLITKKVPCPVCGATVIGQVLVRSTYSKIRTDFKPVGDVIAPQPVLKCPQCHFVLYKSKISGIELDTISVFVKSEAYQQAAALYSDHYLLAMIYNYLGASPNVVAKNYLYAAWEKESDTMQCRQCRELAREYYGQYFSTAVDKNSDDYILAKLKYGELLRLLHRFNAAFDCFNTLKSHLNRDTEQYLPAIEQEMSLISKGDGNPQSSKMKIMQHNIVDEYELYSWGLKGCELAMATFNLDSLYHFEYKQYWWSIVVVLRPRECEKPGRVIWYNPAWIGKMENDWLDMIKNYDKVKGALARMQWLDGWLAADSNRVIETSFLGSKPNAMTDAEMLSAGYAWQHAGLPGSPDVAIKLYRRNHHFCTIITGLKDTISIILEAHSGRGTSSKDSLERYVDSLGYFALFGAPVRATHFLDSLEVEYMQLQSVPSYAVVSNNGRWFINTRRK